MRLNFIFFVCGIAFGAFVTVLTLALTTANRDDNPDDFREYYDAWKEINDEYGVYDDDDEATLNEMFLDLEDDDEP